MTARATVTPEQIERAIAGDRAAVEALTRAFLPRVYGLCFRLTRDRELAEDAAQETFVKALRALPALRERTRVDSWMLTIAANTTRSMLRKVKKTASLEIEPASIDVQVDDVKVARQKAIDHAVKELPGDERELFLLHTVEGVRLKTLAEERSTTVSATKAKVHRIRTKVRRGALAQLERAGMSA
ncbi:RNA polymerase sigma factor [Planctomycetota bacterium]|nr:RNA polymerase sigma factor [Planctomycetota bacterium]